MTAWEWVKARWRWLLAGLAVLVAFLLGVFARRSPQPSPAPAPGPSPKQQDEDAKAAEEERQADAVHDQAIVDAQKQHDASVQQQVDDLKKKTNAVKDDSNEVNQTLIDIGKQVRG